MHLLILLFKLKLFVQLQSSFRYIFCVPLFWRKHKNKSILLVPLFIFSQKKQHSIYVHVKDSRIGKEHFSARVNLICSILQNLPDPIFIQIIKLFFFTHFFFFPFHSKKITTSCIFQGTQTKFLLSIPTDRMNQETPSLLFKMLNDLSVP